MRPTRGSAFKGSRRCRWHATNHFTLPPPLAAGHRHGFQHNNEDFYASPRDFIMIARILMRAIWATHVSRIRHRFRGQTGQAA